MDSDGVGVTDEVGVAVMELDGVIDDEIDGVGVMDSVGDGDTDIVAADVMELEGLMEADEVGVGDAVGVVLGFGQHFLLGSLQKKLGTSSSSPAQASLQLCSLTVLHRASWQHLSLPVHSKNGFSVAPVGQPGVEKHFWSSFTAQSCGLQQVSPLGQKKLLNLTAPPWHLWSQRYLQAGAAQHLWYDGHAYPRTAVAPEFVAHDEAQV